MSYPNVALDTIDTAQSNKEVTANNLFEAESPAALFGCDAANTSGLTFGYYGGKMYVNGAITTIASGTVLLTGSTTNYVESTSSGSVSTNTTGFTAGRIPLYTIVTLTSTIDTVTPARAWVDPRYVTHKASISITTADVTLTAEQARCRHIILSGTLTGNRNLIVPNSGEWIVYNSTSGAFTVTVKTASGTGDTVDQSASRGFFADGTNVISTTSGGSGSADTTQCIAVACSDETTALTTGTAKITFRMPFGFTLSGVRASLSTAQTSGSILTVDINEAGSSILSTKLTIDNSEKTSTTAATAAVISDSSLADDAEITIDIDQVGDGTAKGLKVYLIGTKV
jgi:hypothetical protein